MDCYVILIPLRYCLCTWLEWKKVTSFSLRPHVDHPGRSDQTTSALHFWAAHFLLPALSLMGRIIYQGCLNSLVTPWLVTFLSKTSQQHVLCQTVLQAFFCRNPGTCGEMFCTGSKHCISSTEQQAIEPTSPEPPRFSGPMQKLINSLPPPTACVDVRMVTDTWTHQRGKVMWVTGVHVCMPNKGGWWNGVPSVSFLLFVFP